eukprot:GEMP01120857.1.p1 GENE.GEMP01120857.1~~GEMP01120857.1.p1  ORF type:complete len:133 (-),score=0.85 GEMP01120857.1:147-545(-)
MEKHAALSYLIYTAWDTMCVFCSEYIAVVYIYTVYVTAVTKIRRHGHFFVCNTRTNKKCYIYIFMHFVPVGALGQVGGSTRYFLAVAYIHCRRVRERGGALLFVVAALLMVFVCVFYVDKKGRRHNLQHALL